jgi:hypothetical protein
MAESIPHSNIFKFVALRPPAPPLPKNDRTNFIRDARQAKETPVGRFVASLGADDGAKLPGLLKRFIADHKYELSFPQSEGDRRLREVEAAVLAIAPDKVSTDRLQSEVKAVLGQDASAFVDLDDSKKQLARIWDRYYAFLLLGLAEPQNLEGLTRNLRIHHLFRQLAEDAPVRNAADLRAILSAQPVVDKLYTSVPKPKAARSEPPQAPGPPESKVAEYKELWSDLVRTHLALRDVRELKLTTEAEEKTEDVAMPDACSGREVKSKITRVSLRQAVDPVSFRGLPGETKSVLTALRVTQENFSLPDTVAALSTRLDKLINRLPAVDRPQFMQYMPPAAEEIRPLSFLSKTAKDTFFMKPVVFKLKPNIRGSIKPLGIGDLKVVKQKLKKYAAGEVAHIENVLRGEYKERKHRVLDRVEETITTEVATEEETTRDTQSTDRFELKKESEKTIQEQMSVQAGVTVTGSYGTVTFGAHGDFAYSTSTQESSKSSSNFAREVIDKSLSRIEKKTREERIKKTLHEVEEINTHGVDNKGQPDHVIGIYRWVDKYYEAQIYNYGKRMMFEFIVPEPAAFIEYAQTHQPRKDVVPPKPLPQDFTPADLDDWNYLDFIRDYRVQGCAPPPSEFKTVTATMLTEAKIEPGVAVAKATDLVIPDGYVLSSIAFSLSVIHATYPSVKFSIGSDLGWWVLNNSALNPRKDSVMGTVGEYEGLVRFAINCYDVSSFFVNVVATCQRRSQKYETWQIQTFEKIMTAYQALEAVYAEKLAALEVQQGIVIHGQNPRINRDIEETELKKHCVKMLLDTVTYGSFDAMKQANDDVPDFDIADALQEGKQIQFFEQAFEWENVTYLFYPYFWGRLNQWIHKVNTYDTDPLFTKFLQAGSARVLVPVHPSYNDAVMYYLEHGAIWSGGEAPRLDDPLFISLADELRNLTDDLGKATPEGEPWEVILPTTLVYLQKDAALPAFS